MDSKINRKPPQWVSVTPRVYLQQQIQFIEARRRQTEQERTNEPDKPAKKPAQWVSRLPGAYLDQLNLSSPDRPFLKPGSKLPESSKPDGKPGED